MQDTIKITIVPTLSRLALPKHRQANFVVDRLTVTFRCQVPSNSIPNDLVVVVWRFTTHHQALRAPRTSLVTSMA